MSGAPILVTGAHRSGTTWVGRTLAASGRVGYINEPFNMDHRPGICDARFATWFAYIDEASANGVSRSLERTLEFRYGVAAELRALRSARDAGRMVRDAGLFYRYRRGGRRPLMKDPIALLSAPWLVDRFGMQVVVMIRHPAAFASSLKRLGWTHAFADFERQPALMHGILAPYAERIEAFASGEHDVIDQAGLLWALLHHAIDEYRSAHADWQFVRHEDLSLDPQAGFERMFTQLGLPFERPVREYVAAHTAGANPAEAPKGRAHQLRRDSRANTRNWESRLTADEIERVRTATADVWPRFYTEAEW